MRRLAKRSSVSTAERNKAEGKWHSQSDCAESRPHMKKAKSAEPFHRESQCPLRKMWMIPASVPELLAARLTRCAQRFAPLSRRRRRKSSAIGCPPSGTIRVLVWFAAFQDHCSFVPHAAVIEKFKNELKSFSTSKGTLHFPTNKPLPTALIRKLVKARSSPERKQNRR